MNVNLVKTHLFLYRFMSLVNYWLGKPLSSRNISSVWDIKAYKLSLGSYLNPVGVVAIMNTVSTTPDADRVWRNVVRVAIPSDYNPTNDVSLIIIAKAIVLVQYIYTFY